MNGQSLIFALTITIFIHVSYAPPVDQNKPSAVPETTTNDDTDEQMALNLEYERYLQEVVQLLESDPDFKAKLEKASPEDIKSGKIADELDFLHHGVRSKLNEVKRRELDRLRDALREKAERENGIHELVEPGHIDHREETFEKEDLRKLVIQATKDLDELDKKRAEEFKEYEMKKELEWRQQLANMTEEERQRAIKQHNDSQKKHSEHPEVIHPGSKQQLEEVWQSVDNLPKDTFDANTFFQLHDLTGDGYLDTGELEALFQKELDKVYDKNNPEDDMRERDEEMARMREHVMREWDQNKDGLISRDEFLTDTKKKEFEQNPGWETLEKKKIYSEDDLKAFAEQWARANGIPVQAMYPPYGAYPQHPNQPYPGQQQQPYYGGQPQYPQQVPPNQQFQQQQFGQYPQGGVPYQQYPPHPGMAQQQWAQQQAQQWQQQQQQQWAQQQQGQHQQPQQGQPQFQQGIPMQQQGQPQHVQQQQPVVQAQQQQQQPPPPAVQQNHPPPAGSNIGQQPQQVPVAQFQQQVPQNQPPPPPVQIQQQQQQTPLPPAPPVPVNQPDHQQQHQQPPVPPVDHQQQVPPQQLPVVAHDTNSQQQVHA